MMLQRMHCRVPADSRAEASTGPDQAAGGSTPGLGSGNSSIASP